MNILFDEWKQIKGKSASASFFLFTFYKITFLLILIRIFYKLKSTGSVELATVCPLSLLPLTNIAKFPTQDIHTQCAHILLKPKYGSINFSTGTKFTKSLKN
jgi:hypothetical protein